MDKSVTVTASPVFQFQISDVELAAMIELSRSHYDSVCRGLSSPGDGSFIHRWKMLMQFARTDVLKVTATCHELDLLLKVTERSHPVGSKIHRTVQRIMSAYQDEIAPKWQVEIAI